MAEAISLNDLTPEIASANILAYASGHRLTQGKWHGRRGDGDDGRDIACLLGSIHPQIGSTNDCPAALMPYWLARLTVRLFDGIPAARIYEYGERYGRSIARWGELDGAAWERIRVAFINGALDEMVAKLEALQPAKPHADWPKVQALFVRLRALSLRTDATYAKWSALRQDAYAVRDLTWASWRKAEAVAAAAAAVAAATVAEAVAAAAAAVAAATVAEAAAAAAAAVAAATVAEAAAEAAAVAAAEAAAAAAAEAAAAATVAVARRTTYATLFDRILSCIDAELTAS